MQYSRFFHIPEQFPELVHVNDNSGSTTRRMGLFPSLRPGATSEPSEPIQFPVHRHFWRSQQQRFGLLLRDDAVPARRLALLNPDRQHDARPPGLHRLQQQPSTDAHSRRLPSNYFSSPLLFKTVSSNANFKQKRNFSPYKTASNE